MSIIRLNKADTSQQILGLNGKPIRKNNSLLYKHPDITKSFGINKLKAGQASPFKVQREDNETFDVPFIKSTPDWDAMHTFMNGERAMLRKWNNQAGIEGDGEEFEGNDKPEVLHAVEGVCVEKSATNIVLQSQAFEIGTWDKVSSSISATKVPDPFGNNFGQKHISDITVDGDNSPIIQTISSIPAGVDYVGSIYLQNGGYNEIAVRLLSRNSSNVRVGTYVITINLTTGATTQISLSGYTNYGHRVIDCGNGWYRLVIWVTTVADTDNMRFYMNQRHAGGDGAKGVNLFGAQLEVGAYETLYIPTTTAAFTRPAPAPVLTDFLPTTGSIHGWCDMVRDDGHVFGGDVNLYIDSGKFKGDIFDTTYEYTIPFTWTANERQEFGFILSYTAAAMQLYIALSDGSVYKHTAAVAPTPTASLNAYLGCNDSEANQTSVYFNNIHKSDDDTYTDTEALQLLADTNPHGLTISDFNIVE
jgi:hypothetical protein